MHSDNESPDGPHQVMHEDDPVFTSKYPTVFNRHNLRFAVVALAAVTWLLVVLCLYQILSERADRRHDVDNKIRTLACALVAPFPDSAGPLVAQLRHDYRCLKFQPGKFTIAPSHSPTSNPSPKPVRSP
jgi:hypothetical protein